MQEQEGCDSRRFCYDRLPRREMVNSYVDWSAGHRDASTTSGRVYDELRHSQTVPPRDAPTTAQRRRWYTRLSQNIDNERAVANRAHFFGVAAQGMRRILGITRAANTADARGGGQSSRSMKPHVSQNVPLRRRTRQGATAWLRLSRLRVGSSRRVFFGGLSIEETTKCSTRTATVSASGAWRSWL